MNKIIFFLIMLLTLSYSDSTLMIMYKNIENYVYKYNKNAYKEISKSVFVSSITYSVSPSLIMSILETESHYGLNTKHKNNKVVGVSGIKYPIWKSELKKYGIHHIGTIDNQIRATAIILRYIKTKYKCDSNLCILHRYKGIKKDTVLKKSGLELAQYANKVEIKIRKQLIDK